MLFCLCFVCGKVSVQSGSMMSTEPKLKRVNKTLKDKCQALRELEEDVPNKDVAKKYGVPKNTSSTWSKNKDKYFAALEEGSSTKRKKLRQGDHVDLDKIVFKWFLNVRSQNVTLSGDIVQQKAANYAKELGIEDFQASDGWLWRWKNRYNISFKSVAGESVDVTPEMINPWFETTLPTLLSSYELKDIYDEFGLFYQCQPSQ